RTVEADIHQGQRDPSITGRIYGCNELFSKSLSNVLQTGWVHICQKAAMGRTVVSPITMTHLFNIGVACLF
ncbi:hypothetical protein, partial [Shewanella xiamenensis]|uniref:hypothetical protein n=1 Tax=Shewanella xiamenensis TaxID=332186 RepID=UPI00242D7507